MKPASTLCCTLLLLMAGATVLADEYRSRPTWGDDTLWGYWKFNNDYVPKQNWKLLSVNDEGGLPQWSGQKFIDDDPSTFYYAKGKDVYELVVDLGKSYELGAFTILTLGRPNANVDSMMGRYELFVGETTQWSGEAVAKGDFTGDEGMETVVTIPRPARGRYVKLKAYPRPGTADRPNRDKEICLREFNLVAPEVLRLYATAKPVSNAERKAAWDNRDSEAAVLAFSKDFLDLVYCDQERFAVSMWGREKLDLAAKLKQEGKYREALRAFRDYYFDKLRQPQRYGITPSDVSPTGRGVAGLGDFPQPPMPKDLDEYARKVQMEMADELLNGVMRIDGNKLTIGEPGSVDWTAPRPPYGWAAKPRNNRPYRELYLGTGFRPLWIAYMWTKNPAYLQRWLDYMEDWSLNCAYLGNLSPCVSADDNLYPVVETIRMFGGIAQSLPEASELVKPQTFARIMRKLALESPLNYAVYFRSNCNAWTPGGNQMLLSILLDEFKVSKIYFRETLRRNIEDINAIQMLRDGTDPHQWFGYNAVVLANASVFRLMNARENAFMFEQPAWEKRLHDPAWQVEERELLETRCKWIMRWAAPNGDFPNITQFGSSQKSKTLEQAGRLPTLMNDPTNRRFYEFFYGNGYGPAPDFKADAFPYGGFFIARTGWGQGQGYGALFCSPQPGLNTASKNNVFGLSAYGMDLLNDDIAHNYMHNSSPIQVDGRRQDMDFFVPKTGWPTSHRGELIRSWTDPAPWRWHASDQFNLMEGIYSGAYSNEFEKRDEAVKHVAHQRLVTFARHAGLWIITDRMLTGGKHAYEQKWWLTLRHKENDRGYGGFDHDGLVLDAAGKSLKTKRTRTDWRDADVPGGKLVVGNVNLSMHQFTDAQITYASKEVKSPEEYYDWEQVDVNWQGEGNQQIVTALFPRKPTPEKPHPDGTENDLKSVRPLTGPKGTAGFEAITPENLRVAYLAAKTAGAPLVIGDIAVQGEALLVTRDPAERVTRGMALGCTGMNVRGKQVAIGNPDFEFAVRDDEVSPSFDAIWRPMKPLKILPESDIFANEQKITFECDEPDAVMTYTLDGTDPTLQSTRYTGPFTINRNYVIKGRAYRSEVIANPYAINGREYRPVATANPSDMSGTLATPVTYAKYTRQLYCEAENGTQQTPGLNYEYYEGYWKDLWLLPDKQTPTKKGTVTTLFDMSLIPAENKPLSDKVVPRQNAYSFKYTGYLKVPEDGTYTIHAPREYVHPEQIAGYELQVYLGHATNLDQGQPGGISRAGDLNYWYPATRLHGLGTWSVPLKKGFHEIKIVYIDYRMDAPKRMNNKVQDKDLPETVWTGEKPDLRISGPTIPKPIPIPAGWLWH